MRYHGANPAAGGAAMPEVRAVLFDFGGTLADYGDYMASVRTTFPATLARFGIISELPELLGVLFPADLGRSDR